MKLMVHFLLVVIITNAICAISAAAEIKVVVENPLKHLDDQDKAWCAAEPIDSMLMTVTKNEGPPIQQKFCSAYGVAKAEALTDKAGRDYVLLSYGIGRGTNATDDHLKVYRMERGHLFEIMDILMSWETAPTERFSYNYTARSITSRGLELTLREYPPVNDKTYVPWPGGECCIPSDRTRTIWIDPER